jgi:putative redox protein
MPSSAKPPVEVDLTWCGNLRFTAASAGTSMTLDSDGQAGPSPVQAIAYGLAGCMAIDVVDILKKGRHPLAGCTAHLTARRAEGVPARLVAVDLTFRLTGTIPLAAAQRAVQLSRDKYCSVWHSMRQDIAFDVTVDVVAASVTSTPDR